MGDGIRIDQPSPIFNEKISNLALAAANTAR
jgi:hypothetical protein